MPPSGATAIWQKPPNSTPSHGVLKATLASAAALLVAAYLAGFFSSGRSIVTPGMPLL